MPFEYYERRFFDMKLAVFLVLSVTASCLLFLSIAANSMIYIDTVMVNDAGNVSDSTGYGGVDYAYRIGKYEVTAGQYTAFLNSVAKIDTYFLFLTGMSNPDNGCGISRTGSSGNYSYTVDIAYENRPVNRVSFWNACRFANWLHNGQPMGLQTATTTERGAYTLDGFNGIEFGFSIVRNQEAGWFIPNENEWYKAAYYKGGSRYADYWLFPTQSDFNPGRDPNDLSGNNANYIGDPYPIQEPYYTTVVGEFRNSYSAYGTFDQGGNVSEWTDCNSFGYKNRVMRGGSFNGGIEGIKSSSRVTNNTAMRNPYAGFRVASIPEPTGLLAIGGGLVGLIGIRRKPRHFRSG